MKKYFFDIPVYRLSEEKYDAQTDAEIQENYQQMYLKNGRAKPSISYDDYFEKMSIFYDPWRFNETIGYIRLYFLGHEIRGDYCQHKVSRIYKTRRKHIRYKTYKLADEISILNQNDTQIYESILLYLQKCASELPKRYIDMENFKQIGRYVHWNALIRNETLNDETHRQ
ncbi:hypothetical protein E0765_00025 [Sulfuricurvum sp. IAE1]|uniref:hypothetical protein n=1 Tax=Sulfuricurvum sp. IAE1 TaxID=2546102 RepID=UPI001048C5F7|nr:hypothetical protein [Sulfuricurvum sp. IAE1]TDA69667.1 hypothetical protein E0765_00025 [Sulfuricurvum sp. IAE1]